MMSLPPSVMAVCVWPLVHVTICAPRGSPGASSLAGGHGHPHPARPAPHKPLSDTAQCFHSPRELLTGPVYLDACSNSSPLNTPASVSSFSFFLSRRTASPVIYPRGFVVVLRGGKSSLMYGCWRGNTAQAMRECGNVRMAWCPPGPAHSVLFG